MKENPPNDTLPLVDDGAAVFFISHSIVSLHDLPVCQLDRVGRIVLLRPVPVSRWHVASDQQSTNNRKVAGSRPNKVVCITVLTGNRMG